MISINKEDYIIQNVGAKLVIFVDSGGAENHSWILEPAMTVIITPVIFMHHNIQQDPSCNMREASGKCGRLHRGM